MTAKTAKCQTTTNINKKYHHWCRSSVLNRRVDKLTMTIHQLCVISTAWRWSYMVV